MIPPQYHPQKIEMQIQNGWQKNKTFEVKEDPQQEKFYCLSMFPYPSGKLHMGHVRNYVIGDIISRYQRMQGKNVLQPMGWDAFGLPAENAAIQKGVSPAEWTYDNIKSMRNQLRRFGYAYDWSREITTCRPEYYRWEQWLFIKMYEKGLVYRKDGIVNWDPVDQTVLANEQVVDGRGWRSGALIERRKITQWFIKITDYAEELLKDLDTLPGWPEAVKTMQHHWIGRSEGVELNFAVKNHPTPLSIYTTRADTLFGVTFIAISAEHPLAQLAAQNSPTLQAFIESTQHTKVAEAVIETLEKQGLDTGLKAIHPLTQAEIPIWVTNYVLMEYGTGAVMGVPASDRRDYEFAKKYDLAIQEVIKPLSGITNINEEAFTEKGILVNSGEFTGMTSEQAIDAIANHLAKRQLGQRKVHYHLRDWSISRQRYWGSPIPMIYCEHCGIVPVPYEDLPVVLPENIQFQGVTSPLEKMPEFYQVPCPKCHAPARRETDTFDTFMESSWYYARYTCPDQSKKILDGRVNYWLPIDHYIGGIEHAVMHLLYIRFFHKIMRDFQLLPFDEPVIRLLNHGMVLKDGIKMSKSKGNVVEPETLVDTYGADTIRFFVAFTAPPDQAMEWSDSGIEGSHRFINRLWSFVYHNQKMIQTLNAQPVHFDWETLTLAQKELRQELSKLLGQANYDMERLQFNTVASACMKILNLLSPLSETTDENDQKQLHEGLNLLLRLLNPIAPHITEYLWKELGYGNELCKVLWPKNIDMPTDHVTIKIGVQVNGKLRAQIEIPQHADGSTMERLALNDAQIKQYLTGKTIRKIITVPDRIVNIVV